MQACDFFCGSFSRFYFHFSYRNSISGRAILTLGNDSYWDGGTCDLCCNFFQDEEGNPEPFVAKLRSQYVSEKQEYLQELKNSLGDVTYVQRQWANGGGDGIRTVHTENSHMDTEAHCLRRGCARPQM